MNPPIGQEPGQRILLSSVTIDLAAYRVVRGRRAAGLTAAEVDLLTVLAANPGRLVRYEELAGALHPGASVACGRARIKFTVGQLRKKLGRARGCLQTIFGRGLMLYLDVRGRKGGEAAR